LRRIALNIFCLIWVGLLSLLPVHATTTEQLCALQITEFVVAQDKDQVLRDLQGAFFSYDHRFFTLKEKVAPYEKKSKNLIRS
jgi:hypothetical protein